MLDVYFEKRMDHAQVFKDRYLYVDRPERIDFIYSMGCLPDMETKSDYQGDSNRVLKQFLTRLNRFPIFITFGGSFTDEEVELFFQKHNLSYTKVRPNKNLYYHVQVHDATELELLLDETYWYGAVNEDFFISFTNLLTFERRIIKGWFFKKERIVPVIHVTKEMSFITMEHDFMGYYLFSNEPCFNTEDKVKAIFPDDGTIEFY
ncbi:hypothetical protein F8N00_02325 [Exiguobacterium sp. A1_3_1]|uniref:hypothetical protein n=1 Tax=unclassified Exiguobacterium TaxID=2644629 RepID=UPI0003C3E194|nr:hypothetical protein [Exiguobacterium sp. MH3]AHA31344.1 hypothetical protein U719_07205 [Exiguobacterium sp. MH3]